MKYLYVKALDKKLSSKKKKKTMVALHKEVYHINLREF